MLRPLNDNVVIELIEVERKTSSGILLSGNSGYAQAYSEGIVLAVGEGKIYENGLHTQMGVKANDKVLFNYYQDAMVHNNKKIVIIPVGSILAVVEEN